MPSSPTAAVEPGVSPADTEPAVHIVRDGSRALGFVAIDSTISGRARGGLRLVADLSEEEIRLAARAMTLKYGLLGLPQGGAKAGVFGDPDAGPEERRRVLHRFARGAEGWLRSRRYVPDADLGTSASDIRQMMVSIGISIAPRDWRENRSGIHTARSCLAALVVLAERLNIRLQDCQAAVEGFGKVGGPLAMMLHERGVRVVAVSTALGAVYDPDGLNIPRLRARAAAAGSRFIEDEPGRIDRAALLELPVDLLLPCARLHSVHAGNAERVAARMVCAGANNPVTPEAERALAARGILYPPDFVTNCGGVLGGTLEFAGVPFERIGRSIEHFMRPLVTDLFDRSRSSGVTMRSLAEAAALARHEAVRDRDERRGVLWRMLRLGLEGYRQRWIPQALVAPLAERYIMRRIGT